jgi:hypothetical protein
MDFQHFCGNWKVAIEWAANFFRIWKTPDSNRRVLTLAVLHGFLLSLQENAGMAFQIGHDFQGRIVIVIIINIICYNNNNYFYSNFRYLQMHNILKVAPL